MRHILAFEGNGGGYLAEFNNKKDLLDYQAECEGNSCIITAKESRGAKFKDDEWIDPYQTEEVEQ